MPSLSKLWNVARDDIAQMKEAFNADGYLLLDFGIEPSLLAACAEITQSFLGRYLRVQDGYRRYKPLRQLACDDNVLGFLRRLYGREPVPFQTLNFPIGTQQPSHADNIFFKSEPSGQMCGLWVALEDITMDSGPLHYYPGSHKRDIVTKVKVDADYNGDHYACFADEARNYEKRYALLKRGQAILWAANLLHGGEAIDKAESTRLSQVIHYYFEGCTYTAPILTKPGEATIVRLPFNMAKRRPAWSIDAASGKRIWPHWKQFLVAMRDIALRHVLYYPIEK